jgi:hypothetical protein
MPERQEKILNSIKFPNDKEPGLDPQIITNKTEWR